ncbi:hypothetical protein ECBCE002MS12_2044 [Escherichia coli BCE002_MS12]|nr:hypothetical protein ECBCE002MS12_2044 [Escherichia coli BCE002_MS12]EMX89595.1 hypothetical protein ECBCE001MS16_2119 [Escherichia coli BCE001_MS16]
MLLYLGGIKEFILVTNENKIKEGINLRYFDKHFSQLKFLNALSIYQYKI